MGDHLGSEEVKDVFKETFGRLDGLMLGGSIGHRNTPSFNFLHSVALKNLHTKKNGAEVGLR